MASDMSTISLDAFDCEDDAATLEAALAFISEDAPVGFPSSRTGVAGSTPTVPLFDGVCDTLDTAQELTASTGDTSSVNMIGASSGKSSGNVASVPRNPVGKSISPMSQVQVVMTPKRARRRPKDELLMMRLHVSQLTTRLEQLKLKACREGMAKQHSQRFLRQGEPSAASICTRVLRWKQAAALQLAERQRAEADNHKLKRLLLTQCRKARYLQRALVGGRDTDGERVERILGVSHKSFPAEPTFEKDKKAFKELADGMDALHARFCESFNPAAEMVFQSPSLDIQHETFTSIMTEQERTVMPFPYHATQRAVWESMRERGVRDSKNHYLRSFETTDGTKACSWQTSYKSNLVNADVHLRRMACKYVYKSGAMVVCQTLMEPRSLGDVVLSGLHYRETRCIVVEPSTSSQSASTVYSYLKVERDNKLNSGLSGKQMSRAGITSGIEMAAWKALVTFRCQILENLLIEESCKPEASPVQ